ncbi:MAG: RNA polymerase sigma factor [Ilumatobacter sp.]|jgi:RNA polymerase sigma-70 factor, ECF subfamily|uniref:RNA polymerase sigma factor n=1 Tax=Ilumatobacter sp. TaxID=1967498 RepID=UPI00391D5AFE
MHASSIVDLGAGPRVAATDDSPCAGTGAHRQQCRWAQVRVLTRSSATTTLTTDTTSLPPQPAESTEHDFSALVEEHSTAVYHLARSVVRDASLADDVTQDTFIKVWKHLDDFRGESSIRSWILRIAHNSAVSTLRTIKDSATAPSMLPEGADPIGTTRVVEGRLAADHLRRAIEELDELSREIVVLREVEGMSYDEIAAMLDIPVSTVKTRLLRSRRYLATALAAWRAGEDER